MMNFVFVRSFVTSTKHSFCWHYIACHVLCSLHLHLLWFHLPFPGYLSFLPLYLHGFIMFSCFILLVVFTSYHHLFSFSETGFKKPDFATWRIPKNNKIRQHVFALASAYSISKTNMAAVVGASYLWSDEETDVSNETITFFWVQMLTFDIAKPAISHTGLTFLWLKYFHAVCCKNITGSNGKLHQPVEFLLQEYENPSFHFRKFVNPTLSYS